MKNDNSDIVASAIDSSGFDMMNEPLIPTQLINPGTPSISSISNNILNASTQTEIKELDDLSDCTHKDDNVAYSNADFDLHVGNLSDFMDITKKDDATVCHALVTPDRVEEK